LPLRGWKLSSFRETSKKLGVPDANVITVDNTPHTTSTELGEVGYEAATRIFDEFSNTTAVLTFADMIGAIANFNRHGVRMPSDLSVVGIDASGIGKLMTPTLTSVREPMEKIADEAAGCLIERLEESRTERRDTLVEPFLIQRESAGPSPPTTRQGLKRALHTSQYRHLDGADSPFNDGR